MGKCTISPKEQENSNGKPCRNVFRNLSGLQVAVVGMCVLCAGVDIELCFFACWPNLQTFLSLLETCFEFSIRFKLKWDSLRVEADLQHRRRLV